METEFGLTSGPFNTKYAPLAAFAHRFWQRGSLQPLAGVQFQTGKPDFSIADKLTQILITMLAGCEYISEVNPRLRSEGDLARAWGFERYLEQSSLALALNQLNRTHLSQLEQAVRAIWQRHSRALGHDWRCFLRFDVDLSGLPCGKGAEWSQKGYISGKKHPRSPVSTGQRHLVWGDDLVGTVSRLDPLGSLSASGGGSRGICIRFSSRCGQRSRSIRLSHRPKTSNPVAAGWRLWHRPQSAVVVRPWLPGAGKRISGRRAENLSHQVQRWTPYGDVWLGQVPPPIDYGRPVAVWVKRRLEKERFKHSYYLTTLKVHSISQAMTLYNQRGTAEVE